MHCRILQNCVCPSLCSCHSACCPKAAPCLAIARYHSLRLCGTIRRPRAGLRPSIAQSCIRGPQIGSVTAAGNEGTGCGAGRRAEGDTFRCYRAWWRGLFIGFLSSFVRIRGRPRPSGRAQAACGARFSSELAAKRPLLRSGAPAQRTPKRAESSSGGLGRSIPGLGHTGLLLVQIWSWVIVQQPPPARRAPAAQTSLAGGGAQ